MRSSATVCYHRVTTQGNTQSALRVSAVVAVLLLNVAGCDLRGKPDAADTPVMPDQITDFDKLYSANCAGCHGATGKLGPAPPLNDSLFAAIIPDEELLRVIQHGRAGTPMPAFSKASGGSLTDAQVKLLAEGVKSHWSSGAPLQQTPPAYAVAKLEGLKITPEDRARRMESFQRACAGCHGPNGAGGEGSNSWVGAINAPAFLALVSDQGLRRIIITGRPDLGMPTFAEKRGRPADYQPLSSTEIDDLVALLAEWRSAGNMALAERH